MFRGLGVVTLATFTLSACGSSGPAAHGSAVTLGWSDKGHTVSVDRGARVVVELHNTYWRIRGSSDPSVVRQTGAQRTAPAPPGRCIAGVGCGTVSASFRAVGRGTAHLRASRTTCGEARVCTGGQGRYDVTIRVR
ncbi:MAG: hypothetical protein ACXVZN_00380 [Gaiellaceae bacterium]